MTYTLVVSVRDSQLCEDEIENGYAEILRDLSLFRKGQTPDDLRDAMDFWAARGFKAAIYRDLDGFNDS